MMGAEGAMFRQALREGHALAWALKWEAAIERYRQAVAECPEDVGALGGLANALQKAGRLDEALEQYERLRVLAPDDDTPLARIAELRQRRHEPRAMVDTYLALAEHYLQRSLKAKAVEAWLRLMEGLPDDLEAHERLYRAVSKAGESKLAGKIGLTITRLRGEQVGRAVVPHGTQGVEGACDDQANGNGTLESIDQVVLAPIAELVAKARAYEQSDMPLESLLCFANAASMLIRARAERELAEIEQAAAGIAARYGDMTLGDLAGVAPEARPVVLKELGECDRLLAGGHALGALDACLAAIIAAPECMPVQARLAVAQEGCDAKSLAAQTYLSLAQVYLLRGDQGRALDTLEHAAELGTAGGRVWDDVMSVLSTTELRGRAARDMVSLADRLLLNDKADLAARQLERAAEATPEDGAILMRLGQALAVEGRRLKALKAFRQVPKRAAQAWEAALQGSIVASQESLLDFVAEALETTLEGVGEDTERAERMIDAYRAALAQQPSCLALEFCLGAALGHQGQWNEAVTHLQNAAAGQPRLAASARLRLARYAIDREEVDAAVRQLAVVQRLIAEGSEEGREAWRGALIAFRLVWGEICVRRSELEKAAAAFAEVKRLAPKDKASYTRLAEVHFRRGDAPAAVAELVALGELHAAEGQVDRSLTVYQAAIQLMPANPVPRSKLAEAFLSLGRVTEALATLNGLAEVLAGDAKREAAAAVLRQMVELCKQSDPARALALRERIARLLPANGEARQELIAAYLAAGRSEAVISEAMALWHEMEATGRTGEAMAAVQQVLQVDPWNADALVGLGLLHEQLGDIDAAVAAYRRALDASAENEAAASRLDTLANT